MHALAGAIFTCAVLFAPIAEAAAPSACRARGQTVRATPHARLYIDAQRLYGCLKPRGASRLIWDGRAWSDPVAELHDLRLAGDYFAGVLPWWSGPYDGILIRRTNLASGATRTTIPIAAADMEVPSVDAFVLARRGGVAWGASSSFGSTIRCWGRRGRVRVLDDDSAVDSSSLRLQRGVLLWMHAGATRRAAMC